MEKEAKTIVMLDEDEEEEEDEDDAEERVKEREEERKRVLQMKDNETPVMPADDKNAPQAADNNPKVSIIQ